MSKKANTPGSTPTLFNYFKKVAPPQFPSPSTSSETSPKSSKANGTPSNQKKPFSVKKNSSPNNSKYCGLKSLYFIYFFSVSNTKYQI